MKRVCSSWPMARTLPAEGQVGGRAAEGQRMWVGGCGRGGRGEGAVCLARSVQPKWRVRVGRRAERVARALVVCEAATSPCVAWACTGVTWACAGVTWPSAAVVWTSVAIAWASAAVVWARESIVESHSYRGEHRRRRRPTEYAKRRTPATSCRRMSGRCARAPRLAMGAPTGTHPATRLPRDADRHRCLCSARANA